MNDDIYTTCERCNKRYENIFRTYYVQKGTDDTTRHRVCPACRDMEKHIHNYYYQDHISPLEKKDLITRFFNTKEDLLTFIKNNTTEGYIPCMDCLDKDFSLIMEVNKIKREWHVVGLSNLSEGDLPIWHKKVVEIQFSKPKEGEDVEINE